MRAAPIATVMVWALVAGFLCEAALATDEHSREEPVFVLSHRQLSLSEYISELDRLTKLANQSLDNPAIAREAFDEPRGTWKVDANGQSFTISTGWLIDQFEKLQKNPTAEVRDDILQRLNALKADATAFQQTPADTAGARAKLTQVLARSEFHQVHGATWWDRLKFRIEMWIFRMLSRFFGSSSAPMVGRFFVWTLVGIAVLALAYFVFRTMRQNARLETIMPEVLPVSAKQWRVWMKEARAAAAKGLWRDAVHLAYWGGISFLEESGAWRPDQARTPREYLRLLPADSQHRTALSTLTRRLEVTWYGNEVAGLETFTETLSHLEGLGCRE